MNKKIKDLFDKIDFGEILDQVDKDMLDASIDRLQSQMHKIREIGEAGGGLVKIEINGHRKVSKVDIDESLLTPENKSTLQDLMVAAINIANEKVESAIEEKATEYED